ncbi:MAG: type II secretion system secretin GspD [Candidatus Thiodiazotropha sp.]
MRIKKHLSSVLALALSVLVSSCATQQGAGGKAATPAMQPPPPETAGIGDEESLILSQESQQEPKFFVKQGTGVFLKHQGDGKAGAKPAQGDITLNFEGVDLREVIKVIFEEILRENYLIDEKVQGVVTIHTTLPVTADAVMPILETILQMNGAALVRNGSVFKIVPMTELKDMAVTPHVGSEVDLLKAGQGVQIVPLKFITAKEMKKILETFSSSNEQIHVDTGRNLMILTGSYQQIRNMLQTIDMFDVDWLSGMSFGLIPIKFTDAKTLTDELNNILGEGETSPMAGMIRLIPVQRLNAVMVISQQPRYIDEARKLIGQFDQGSDKSPDRRLYVYHLKNGKAETIATILQSIFGNQVSGTTTSSTASGNDPLSRSNVRPPTSSGISLASSNADANSNLAKTPPAAAAPVTPVMAKSGAADQGGGESQTTIIADPDNNAILVMASPMDYNKIKSTIARLDVAPKQVLIEATIAEVVLTNNLSYGVRWFFEGNIGNRKSKGGLGVPLPAEIGGDGFSLGIFGSSGELKAFFDILDTESNVKFLSAPQIMVIDNQTATFRVGDQIPIVTRASQSTTDPNAPIVSEVQYRDTGTLLKVTPRINEGGMVTLEINQEVSNPGAEPAVGGGGNVSISQRTIESTVIVHDGQTIVLGGLIRERKTNSKGGIPLLMDLPMVGNLFSSTTKDVNRTELIITLTPKVVRNPHEAYEISQELRDKIREATLYQDDFNNRRAMKQ